jgi:hypothetical protein
MSVRKLDRSVYDTKEGIATMLGSYDDLYALFAARREAGYECREQLTAYVIFGRFFADGCGNWIKLDRETFTDDIRGTMPTVMDMDEYNGFVEAQGLDALMATEGSGHGFVLPPPDIACAHCGRGWTLEGSHDFDIDGGFDDVIELGPYAGKTLAEVQAELSKRTDGEYRLMTAVRNDRWITADPAARFADHEGWRDEDSDPAISMDYVVRNGDQGSVYVTRYYHGPCYRSLQAAGRAQEESASIDGIRLMFEETGFGNVRVEKAPLPPHILAWIRSDDDAGEFTDEQLNGEMSYLRVATDQGSLGVFMAVYPALDLEGTGIGIKDFDPQAPDEMAALPIVSLTGEPQQLLKLWQLMTKKQRP